MKYPDVYIVHPYIGEWGKVEIGQRIRFAIEKVLIGSENVVWSVDGKWLMGRQLHLNILHNELQFVSNVLQPN